MRAETLRSTALIRADGTGPDHGAGQPHGLVQGGVGGHPHGEQLVRADPQGIQDRGVQLVQRPVDAARQDGVVRALAAEGAVAELGGESGVALVQSVVPDPGRQHEVRVGVLGCHGAEHFEGHEPGRIGPAGPLGGGALGEAALRAAVAFPALGVPPAAAAGALAAWLGAGLAAVVPRAGCHCRGRCRWSRTRSFEYHAFKCCLSTRPISGGHHFLARRLDPGQFHRVRTRAHQDAFAVHGQLSGREARRTPGRAAPAPA